MNWPILQAIGYAMAAAMLALAGYHERRRARQQDAACDDCLRPRLVELQAAAGALEDLVASVQAGDRLAHAAMATQLEEARRELNEVKVMLGRLLDRR